MLKQFTKPGTNFEWYLGETAQLIYIPYSLQKHPLSIHIPCLAGSASLQTNLLC